jgi:hypothetical protein
MASIKNAMDLRHISKHKISSCKNFPFSRIRWKDHLGVRSCHFFND